MPRLTRRRALGGAAALVGTLAGCSALPADRDDDQSYDRLARTATYVSPNADLEFPAELPAVENTHNADLLVLPGDTAHGPDQAADWLAADQVVALVGDGAERRWLDWARSDAFEDTFESPGASDAEPDPTLVVAAAVGTLVHTYRHSWADSPRDRDVLRAIDEDLGDVESETPP
ncbi:MAG: hypothetical protein U5J98_01300 [Halobacteriales archaeon]|nr:hypothetical protein [Halobacteriales archaeon]